MTPVRIVAAALAACCMAAPAFAQFCSAIANPTPGINIGATDDSRFRAFDAKTGKELWVVKLGAAAHATPSTYLARDGRQYVVITSTGGGFLDAPTADDSITAFALPPRK